MLSSIFNSKKFSFFSKTSALVLEDLFKIFFKFSRFTPSTSSPDSNSLNALFGILRETIEIFPGSIATSESPNSLILILTSRTKSEINSIAFVNKVGSSNFSFIFF